MKKIIARKITDGPVRASIHPGGKVIVAKIEVVGPAASTDKSSVEVPFVLARIRERFDYAGEFDACLCVGFALGLSRSLDTSIFFWNDKFWMKGTDKLGISWFKDKAFALYEVEVSNPEFMEDLKPV